MKRFLLTSLIIFVLCLGLVPARAMSHDDSSNSGGDESALEQKEQEIEDREQARLQRQEALSAKKCEKIKTRLEAQRDKGLEIRDHRLKRYLHIVDRLNNLADRLDDQNIDTKTLRASIQQLSDLIKTYSTSFADFESELQTAINSSCDESGAVKENVKTAREKLAMLKSNADDIHTFFQQQLKPLLQTIKDQIKQLHQSSSTETETPESQDTNTNQNDQTSND